MSAEHIAALDAHAPTVREMVESVPADLTSVEWLTNFAIASTASPADAVQFLARLYVAADNHVGVITAQLNAAAAASNDFYAIIAKHRAALSELAYGGKAEPEQCSAATDLLNGAGLSRYHIQPATADQIEGNA